ncbi:MAG: hypothetical protein K2X27_01520, partial [Candidatus Obscuribacterales bacterium]|nr:hypothetical protein [Candidatus Obscuribacterales bacterium]
MYFNSFGQLARDINALGQETVNEYDGLNRLISVTFPELNVISSTYDNNNNELTKTWQAKPGSPLANIVNTFEYDATWNKVSSFTDGENNTTTFEYDATQGTLLAITRPTIGMDTPTVTFTYNSRGQIETRTDETGIVDKFEYDATNETLLTA